MPGTNTITSITINGRLALGARIPINSVSNQYSTYNLVRRNYLEIKKVQLMNGEDQGVYDYFIDSTAFTGFRWAQYQLNY